MWSGKYPALTMPALVLVEKNTLRTLITKICRVFFSVPEKKGLQTGYIHCPKATRQVVLAVTFHHVIPKLKNKQKTTQKKEPILHCNVLDKSTFLR